MSISMSTSPSSRASGTTLPVVEPRPASFQMAAIDLYKDIHKGIRSELFAVTSTAGNLDPSARLDRVAIADHLGSIAALLTSHAHHEDDVIDPVLEEHQPALAAQITGDHEVLEARFDGLVALAREAVDAVARDQRRLTHLLHLELSSFTSAYLAHQHLEERVVMPALEEAIGPDAVLGLHQAIVASIPPDEMARSLALMLPAMNVEDRVEMLTGIRASAPAEVFAAVVDLTRSVLPASDLSVLEARGVWS